MLKAVADRKYKAEKAGDGTGPRRPEDLFEEVWLEYEEQRKQGSGGVTTE